MRSSPRADLEGQVDDVVEDAPEISLPRKVRRQFNRAQSSFCSMQECQNSKVDISEVFSPPRAALEAQKQGLKAGNSYDIQDVEGAQGGHA